MPRLPGADDDYCQGKTKQARQRQPPRRGGAADIYRAAGRVDSQSAGRDADQEGGLAVQGSAETALQVQRQRGVVAATHTLAVEDLLLQPAKAIAQYNPLSFIVDAVRDPVVFAFSTDDMLKALLGLVIIGGFGTILAARALRHRLRTG